jgi:preprotein translocase subunit YajC
VNNLGALLPLVLILLVFWFLIIRPQRRRAQQLTATQSSLGIGSEVMLTSGIFGTVVSLEEETIHLEIAPGTTVKIARQAVVRVVEPHRDEPTDTPSATDPRIDPPADAAGEPRLTHPDEETR